MTDTELWRVMRTLEQWAEELGDEKGSGLRYAALVVENAYSALFGSQVPYGRIAGQAEEVAEELNRIETEAE